MTITTNTVTSPALSASSVSGPSGGLAEFGVPTYRSAWLPRTCLGQVIHRLRKILSVRHLKTTRWTRLNMRVPNCCCRQQDLFNSGFPIREVMRLVLTFIILAYAHHCLLRHLHHPLRASRIQGWVSPDPIMELRVPPVAQRVPSFAASPPG